MEKEIIKPGQSLIKLENISSQDYYYLGDNKARAVVKNINLEVLAGDITGVSSYNIDEVKILCEIMGNLRSYYEGRCRVGTMGMVATKKKTLPQLYYLDSYSKVYDNMQVLEYFMFITDNLPTTLKHAERQKTLLDLMVSVGLGYISLTLIQKLTPNEKMLLELFSAYISPAPIVVANISDYEFDDKDIQVIKKIANLIVKDQNRCLVIGTMEAKLIGIVCNKTLFTIDGKPRYNGGVDELVHRFDHIKVIINDAHQKEMMATLQRLFPELIIEADGRMILVRVPANQEFNQKDFLLKLVKHNVDPDSIKINRGRVQNSFEEVAKR